MAIEYRQPFVRLLDLNGDGTLSTNLGIKVGSLGNANYVETGGGVEDEWTLSSHGLTVGAKVQFTAVGTGATGYAGATDYWVAAVPDGNTFTLAATKGGTAIEGTGDSGGTWTIARQAEEFYVDGASQAGLSIERVVIEIRDNAAMTGTSFGAIAAGTVTTGFSLQYQTSDGTVITDLTPTKIVDNLGFGLYGYDVDVKEWGASPNDRGLLARWTFTKYHPPGLDLTGNQKLVATIDDDLSTLVGFTVAAEGTIKIG